MIRRAYRSWWVRLGDRFYPAAADGHTLIRRGGFLCWLYERLPRPW